MTKKLKQRKKQKKCTPRQLAYCYHRVTPNRDGSAMSMRAAYLAAGFKAKTKLFAGVAATKLEKMPHVKKKLAELSKRIEVQVVCKAGDVIAETMKVAFLDIADIYNKDGSIKEIHEMPEAARRAITGIKHNPDGSIKEVRFGGKMTALDQLHKNVGNYNADNEQKQTVFNTNIVLFAEQKKNVNT